MGYATKYKISSKGKEVSADEMEKINNLIKEASFLPKDLREVAMKGIEIKKNDIPINAEDILIDIVEYNPFECECKWYEHETDMKKASKQYPDTIFILEGEGEESGDIWKKYFLNGKMQICKSIITFEEFDESKLN